MRKTNQTQIAEDRYPMHRGRGRDKRHTAKQQRQLGRRTIGTALLQMQKGWK